MREGATNERLTSLYTPKPTTAKGWTPEVWVRYRYEAKVQRNRGAAETSPTISTGDGSAEEGDEKGGEPRPRLPPQRLGRHEGHQRQTLLQGEALIPEGETQRVAVTQLRTKGQVRERDSDLTPRLKTIREDG